MVIWNALARNPVRRKAEIAAAVTSAAHGHRLPTEDPGDRDNSAARATAEQTDTNTASTLEIDCREAVAAARAPERRDQQEPHQTQNRSSRNSRPVRALGCCRAHDVSSRNAACV